MEPNESSGPTEVGPDERIRAMAQTVAERGADAGRVIDAALDDARNATASLTTELAQIKDRAAEVHTIVEGITVLKGTIETARVAAEENRRISQSHAEDIARFKTEAATASSTATAKQVSADSVLTQINSIRSKVEQHQRQAEASDTALAALAAKADAKDQSLKEYETQLETLLSSSKAQADALLEKIRSLLPEGTSAGLASAFEQRRRALQLSRGRWMILFVVCLGLLFLVSLAAADLIQVPGFKPLPQAGDWHDFALGLARKLVAVAAPLWLALVSGSQLRSLLRLEEEYAHKVAMSIAFEGYKREVSAITGKEGLQAALTEAVIETLRTSPVRLFDSKRSAETPLEVAADGFAKITGALGDAIDKVGNVALKLNRKA